MTVSNFDYGNFGERWNNTVEYIEDITYRIWEQRDLDLIRYTYTQDCPVFTLSGCVFGAEVVIENTRRVLDIFPDRTLYPADILWNGKSEPKFIGNKICRKTVDNNGNVPGIHSSHLIKTSMTFNSPEKSASKKEKNSQSGNRTTDIGPESHGKEASFWVIAHCIIQGGMIVREWLVRDNQHLYEQLGVDWKIVAQNWAQKWAQEINDPSRTSENCGQNFSQFDFLKSEYRRVSKLEKETVVKDNFPLNLDNIFLETSRPICEILAKEVVSSYKMTWGAEGLSSKSRFEELVNLLYHPHVRFESPQAREFVGSLKVSDLYEQFVITGLTSANIQIAIDWAIIRPDSWKILNPENVPRPEYCNRWVYPIDSDVRKQKALIDSLQNPTSHSSSAGKEQLCEQIPEKYTIAIRWTLIGDFKGKNMSDNESVNRKVPLVLLGESYLECAGVRINREIQVWDAVGLQAQKELAKLL